MPEIGPEITLQKVGACLRQLGISEKDYLRDSEVASALSQLNGGAFDPQIFEELWDQCRLNSRGEAKVVHFMQHLIKAEEILLDKIKALDSSIIKQQMEKKPAANDYTAQRQYREHLLEQKQERSEARKALQTICKLFQISTRNPAAQPPGEPNSPVRSRPSTAQLPEERPENQLFEYDISSTPEMLSKIVYLTLFLLFLSWLGSQLFNRFIDMTLCFVILTGYCTEAISRKIVKLNLILLAFSFTGTLVWLIVYTDKLWDPEYDYEFPMMNRKYLEASIFLLFLSEAVKLVLCYYYLTQLHVNEAEVFTVSLCSKSILMKAEPIPPIPSRHPLAHALTSLFNRPLAEQPELEDLNQ